MINVWDQFKQWLTTRPQQSGRLRPWRGWLLVIPAAYVIAVAVSALYHMPTKLPGVALGLPALLDMERGAALLAVFSVVWIFAFLTSRGDLPTSFGNLAYPPRAREHELELRVAELSKILEDRLTPLEEGKEMADEALPILTREVLDLRDRLHVVELRRKD